VDTNVRKRTFFPFLPMAKGLIVSIMQMNIHGTSIASNGPKGNNHGRSGRDHVSLSR
jgi:hypothetical protein